MQFSVPHWGWLCRFRLVVEGGKIVFLNMDAFSLIVVADLASFGP